MRIQVLFNSTSVLVPCGDGKLSVRELVEKAIDRYKKVLNKHPDDIIEVRSLRLADSGSFVVLDDEVADVLEDKEVVLLDFELIPHFIRDTTSNHIIAEVEGEDEHIISAPLPYTDNVLDDEDSAPFSSNIHDSLLSSALPSIGEDFDDSELRISVGNHASQELHHLEGVDSAAMPVSIHMDPSGASQDIDIGNSTWHSQNSGSQSQDPSDTGYGNSQVSYSQSQPSYSQSQPKSQETPFPNSGGSDGLGFSNPSSSGMQDHKDFPPPHTHSLPRDQQEYTPHSESSRLEFGRSKGSPDSTTSGVHSSRGEHHYLTTRKDDNHHSKTGRDVLKTMPPYGHRDNDFVSRHGYQSHDMYSPGQVHLRHPSASGLDYSPMGQPYDHFHSSWGYGTYPLPSLDEGGSGYDKARYYDHFKRRSLSMYSDHYHGGSHPYSNPPPGAPPGGHMIGHFGGHPAYHEMYNDPRSGRYGIRPTDPHFQPTRINHAYSHDRIDGAPPMGPGGMRSRPPFMGRPEEDMFLSQPTNSYFGYDQPGAGFGVTMMTPAGPMYSDARFAMSGPSPGVSLSQPGVMLSHRPGYGGMLDMDRHGPHPYMGGASGDKGLLAHGGVGSKLTDSRRVDRASSIDEELDWDVEEEEGHSKGPNPFQRDLRKSIFRDGSVYTQWMERMYNYDIQETEENTDIPHFEGESNASLLHESPATDQSGVGGVEEGEDSGEEDEEYGNIHIVELHKCDESLGIRLTHYTSPDSVDLGVYIAAMDENGFAIKSGKLQVHDRILACNGCDFTKDMKNSEVEEIFTEMIKEPLLRMAISRGGMKNAFQNAGVNGTNEDSRVSKDGLDETIEESIDGEIHGERGGVSEEDKSAASTPSRPAIKTVAPPATPSQPPSLSLTNTRQIGMRHTIKLKRGNKGFGLGLTSRDVSTDEQNQPIYVKTVHHGGSAFYDGRLRIGDRILEVDGVDVSGMSRQDVVKLLRDATDSVTLVISRQEVIEELAEQELTPPPSGEDHAHPLTVNKTVLKLGIPLHNSGPAGLGVTVYTKSTSSKVGGEMGVYIKSIVPGGAAALDGQLHKNDQVLSVNQQNLLGHSNQEAMEILRHAMANKDTVELVVARRATTPLSPSMAALGEEPEEEEKERSQEVGIDVPANDLSARLGGKRTSGSVPNLLVNSSSLQLQTSLDSRSQPLALQTSLEQEPSRGSIRGRASTLDASSPNHKRGNNVGTSSSPLLKSILHRRSQDLAGSGELYDKLEPLIPPSPTLSAPVQPYFPHSSHISGHSPFYDEVASTAMIHSDRNADLSRLAGGRDEASTLDRMNMTRIHSGVNLNSAHQYPPHTSRDLSGGGSSSLSSRLSPSDIDYTIYSPTSSSFSSRENTMTSQHHRRNLSYESHSSHYSDTTSITSQARAEVGVADAPIRGSGRKDRNKPERGSGRSHASQSPSSGCISAMSSASPELILTNGYATIPRTHSHCHNHHRGDIGGGSMSAMETMSPGSLENLRLSDSESNMAFRRDNPGRISITKKTKKNPREDFAHLRFDNSTPLIEGEKPPVRAGSDGFLNEHNSTSQPEFMQGLEIGPNLGMVKSSSLESLHNVMHHTIKRDIVDDGSDLRNRSTRNSFRRAVDRSYDNTENERNGEEQRGVDVDFSLENGSSTPALISFTKSPYTTKTKKKGFFQKVFKKRKTTKKEKPSPAQSRKFKGKSMEVSPASLTAEERDQLMRHYTLQLRSQPQAPPLSNVTTASNPDIQFSSLPSGNRNSMPVLDDYDSPGSPDEVLLATMAKV